MMNYEEGVENEPTIHDLPEEAMRQVFFKMDADQTLRLRKSCRVFKDNIEAMYTPSRCVLIYFKKGFEAEDLAQRFFANHLDKFERMPIKAASLLGDDGDVEYASTLTLKFMVRITKMFPNAEHLLVDTELDALSANALISQLPLLTKICTLSLFRVNHLPDTRKAALRNAINRCDWIRRLGITDLGKQWWRYLNFSHLEHFALESPENNMLEVIRRLTPRTFSLWTRIGGLSPQNVEEWVKFNPHFVESLEVLHLGDIADLEESARAYVNVSAFIHLDLLRIQFEVMSVGGVDGSYIYATLDPLTFASMTGLFELDQLELIGFRLDLYALSNANLQPLETVLKLKLTRFIGAPAYTHFDGAAFCRFFSRLFPCLETLILVVIRPEDGQAVEQCLGQKPFPHLKNFDCTLYVEPVKEKPYWNRGHDYTFE